MAGLDLKPEYALTRLGDLEQSYANIDKALTKLRWKPEIGLEDGLKHLVDSNLWHSTYIITALLMSVFLI